MMGTREKNRFGFFRPAKDRNLSVDYSQTGFPLHPAAHHSSLSIPNSTSSSNSLDIAPNNYYNHQNHNYNNNNNNPYINAPAHSHSTLFNPSPNEPAARRKHSHQHLPFPLPSPFTTTPTPPTTTTTNPTDELLKLNRHITTQVQQARRLFTTKAPLVDPAEREWLSVTIADTEDAARDVAQLLESARVDQELHHGRLGLKSRMRWKLFDSQRAKDRRDRLLLCHQSLMPVMTRLQQLGEGAPGSGPGYGPGLGLGFGAGVRPVVLPSSSSSSRRRKSGSGSGSGSVYASTSASASASASVSASGVGFGYGFPPVVGDGMDFGADFTGGNYWADAEFGMEKRRDDTIVADSSWKGRKMRVATTVVETATPGSSIGDNEDRERETDADVDVDMMIPSSPIWDPLVQLQDPGMELAFPVVTTPPFLPSRPRPHSTTVTTTTTSMGNIMPPPSLPGMIPSAHSSMVNLTPQESLTPTKLDSELVDLLSWRRTQSRAHALALETGSEQGREQD